MRRLVVGLLSAAAFAASSPALAKDTVETLPAPGVSNLLPITSACDPTLTNPDAVACSGYFGGNLLNGSPTDIVNAQDAIEMLPGDYQWSGNWSDVEATLVGTLVNGNQLDFGQTMFGQTIIGAHFGNIAGAAANVTVFWLFDFGTEGANFITLDDTQGFSHAALYTTGAAPGVPEPATWAMMLFGFGLAGLVIRRKRQPAFAQMA